MENFLKDDIPSRAPFLVLHINQAGSESLETAQIFVVLENDVLCECQPLLGHSILYSSLVTLMAVHFAFNLQYQETEKNLFKFLEHMLDVIPKRKSYSLKQIENKLLSKLNSPQVSD